MTGPEGGTIEVLGRRVAAGTALRGEFTYSVIEPARGQRQIRASGERQAERRDDRRLRSHLREGFVAEGRGRVVADCRIRDMSKTGARLQLDKDRPLPKFFLLTEAGTRRRYRATLAWQVGRDAGVRLTPVE